MWARWRPGVERQRASADALDANSVTFTLGEMLGLETVEGDDPCAAMDGLAAREVKIEKALAERHLHDGSFVL